MKHNDGCAPGSYLIMFDQCCEAQLAISVSWQELYWKKAHSNLAFVYNVVRQHQQVHSAALPAAPWQTELDSPVLRVAI